MTTRTLLIIMALGATLMYLSTCALGAELASASATTSASAKCWEDEPCYVWATMGNLKRGIVVCDARASYGARCSKRLVVGPCAFARLYRADRINWDVTPLLRGDWHAINRGCAR